MTAGGCVGTATISDFGKQLRIVYLHRRGMYRNWKQGRSCPSLAVLFRHLLRQIVLTEPLWISCFLTAGNTAGKISLVQIMSPFSCPRDFLHDHLGTVMVGTWFNRKIRTFPAFRRKNSGICHTESTHSTFVLQVLIVKLSSSKKILTPQSKQELPVRL